MALTPTTTTPSSDDGVVPAEEKAAHREDMMEALAARRTAEMEAAAEEDLEEEEVEASADPEPGIDPEPEPEPEPEPSDEEAEEPVEAAAEAEEEPEPEETMVEVTIDGETQVLPLSKVVAGYQIESAARRRLNEATELLNTAREANDELTRARHQSAAPAEEPTPEPALPVTETIDWQDLTRSLQFDDPEESAKRLKAVVEELRQVPDDQGQVIDPDVIETRVLTAVTRQNEWNNAMSDLGREYDDILSDPKLAALAGAQSNRYLQEELGREQQGHPRRPFYDILAQGADEIRIWARDNGFKVKGGGDSEDGSPDPNDPPAVDLKDGRQELKEKASGTQPRPRVVRRRAAPSTSAAAPTEMERARTAIDEIRKARGQLG